MEKADNHLSSGFVFSRDAERPSAGQEIDLTCNRLSVLPNTYKVPDCPDKED